MSFSFKQYMESTRSSDFGELVSSLHRVSNTLTSYKQPIYDEMKFPFQYAGDYLIEQGNEIKGNWLHSFIPILQERIDGYTEYDSAIQITKWNRTLWTFCHNYDIDRFFGFYNERKKVFQEFSILIPMNPFVGSSDTKDEEGYSATVIMPVDDDIVNECMHSSMGVNQYSRTMPGKDIGLCGLDVSEYFTPGSNSYFSISDNMIYSLNDYRVVNPVLRYYDSAEKVPGSAEYGVSGMTATSGGIFRYGNSINSRLKPEVLSFINQVVEGSNVYAIGNDIETYGQVYLHCTKGVE